MYLYSKDKSKNKLIIYSLDTTIEKISKFKKEQMSTIPEGLRVLVASTNYKKCLETSIEGIAYRELNYDEVGMTGGNFYHNLGPSIQLDDVKKEILEKYYNELGPTGELKRITYGSSDAEFKYLLLNNPEYRSSMFDNSMNVMTEIINIPRLLFVYERFIRNNLLDISDKELKKILDLYTLSEPLDTIDLNEVNKLTCYKVAEAAEPQLLSQLSRTEKILSLIKK